MRLDLLGKYIGIMVSYYIGRPFYAPDSVSIVVTEKCNLKCYMCDFWKHSAANENVLTLSEFKMLFEDLSASGIKTVQLTGGEPFLRKDLIDILKLAKACGLKTVVVTNGTLINEANALEVVENTDLFYISLDSPLGAQHESIRGVPGIFEKVKGSVRLLTNQIKQKGLKTRIVFTVTMSPAGIHKPLDMVNLAKELSINGIIYNPASSVNYGYTTLKSPFNEDKEISGSYNQMVDNIIGLMDDPGNMIKSNPFYIEASKMFLAGHSKYYKFPCYGGGYNGPLITFDGTVFPCCAWNMKLGNIRQQKFSKIWKSKNAAVARSIIKKGKCPVCFHHTRTFDFVARAPFMIKDVKKLFSMYKNLLRSR